MTRRASLAIAGVAAGILILLFVLIQASGAKDDDSLVRADTSTSSTSSSAQDNGDPGSPGAPAAPRPLPGGEPPAQAAETLEELVEVAGNVNPDIVEQTVCGLRGSVLRNLIGDDFNNDWDVLRDASLVAEDLARTYAQVADADRNVFEGVRLVQQVAIAWRTALGYAEAGEIEKAEAAMELANGYLQRLDKPGTAAELCPN